MHHKMFVRARGQQDVSADGVLTPGKWLRAQFSARPLSTVYITLPKAIAVLKSATLQLDWMISISIDISFSGGTIGPAK